MKQIPDLLNATPQQSEKFGRALDSLGYAFTTGDSEGALSLLLNHWDSPDSIWKPENFADDIFIDDLVKRMFITKGEKSSNPANERYFMRILCSPPADFASVTMRQNIFNELQKNTDTKKRLWDCHRLLVDLRNEFDASSLLGPGYFTRKRIDILNSIKAAVDMIAVAFDNSESELKRVSTWAKQLANTEAYNKLNHFLDYDQNLATVSLQVKVGADGRITRFRVDNINENENNRFYQTPLGRILTKLSLIVRGYKIDNDSLVARWVELVFDELKEPLAHFIELIGHFEFYLAGLHFMNRCKKAGLKTSIPTFQPENASYSHEFRALFNPLLIDQNKPVVPCDLSIDANESNIIVTGPNSGGKTRLLQAISFVHLLAQSGLPVPAARACLRPIPDMFVSLAEWADSDQKEGRLGTELLRIKKVFEKSQRNSLVILDELCSGTNPSEGEEIFYLVLTLLDKLKSRTFISTHFLRFAEKLQDEKDTLNIRFLQVDLDYKQLPTYQFVEGVAQTSLAAYTASRLGVSREDLVRIIEEKQDAQS